MNVSALKSANFRLYLAGNLFAVNAFWILRVTVGWIAWDVTGSASFVGLIAFLHFAPTIFAGPFFGVLTDRVNVRRAAIVVQSALMCLSLLLFAADLLGALGAPQLRFYAAAAGIAMAAHGPLRMSMAPRLVRKDNVASVIYITAINFNLARMTGPAIGGWLIASFDTKSALAVVACCYVPFLAALSVIRVRPRVEVRSRPLPFLGALMEGLHLAARNAAIRNALMLTGIGSFFVHGALEILPVLADGVFERGAGGLGALTSAAGIGALLSAVSFAVLPQAAVLARPWQVITLCYSGLFALAALAITDSWALAMALIAAMAYCATGVGITCQRNIQMGIDDTIRGRAMSLWAVVSVGSAAAGAGAQGAMSDFVGIERTFLLAAGIAAAVLAIHGLRQIRS